MTSLKILFLHGKEGTPEGTKPTFLREKGHLVIAPVLPKDDWELSVRRAYDCLNAFKPDVVVGSSRGGAVTCALETAGIPKILIAPAYRHFGVEKPLVDETTTILHCPKDDLVMYKDSHDLTALGARLITCGENHRMSDPEALATLLKEVEKVKA